MRLAATETLLGAFEHTGGRRRRLVIVQHVLPDTEEFIRLLQLHGFDVACVVAIPYSLKLDVVERIRQSGVRVEVPGESASLKLEMSEMQWAPLSTRT